MSLGFQICNPYLFNSALEYPPAAFTSASNVYVQSGLYPAKAAGTYYAVQDTNSIVYNSSYPVWRIFNKVTPITSAVVCFADNNQDYQGTPAGAYSGKSYNTVTTLLSGSTILGIYIQLSLPCTILLSYYVLSSGGSNFSFQTNFKNWNLLGSNTGNNDWVIIDTQVGITWGTNPSVNPPYYLSGNTTAYQYYRIVVTAITGNNYIICGQLKLFGN